MPHIHPTSDLKNNLNHLSEICRKEHEPVYLTRKGHGELVLMRGAFDLKHKPDRTTLIPTLYIQSRVV